MTRMPVSYATIAATLESQNVKDNVGGYIVKRLLDAKLVIEQVETVSYPNVRGKFEAQNAGNDFDEYDIALVPGTNQIKGVRNQHLQNNRPRQSTFTGSVDEHGFVTLPNGCFQYQEDGLTAYLMDTDRVNVTNYKGMASGTTAAVKYYVYSFSPELKAQIEKTTTAGPLGSQTGETINGGTYDIGEVSDLQLGLTPTVATASFAWTVTLSKLGKLFYGADNTPTGKERVGFVKKPDGTWTLKEWCVTNCMF